MHLQETPLPFLASLNLSSDVLSFDGDLSEILAYSIVEDLQISTNIISICIMQEVSEIPKQLILDGVLRLSRISNIYIGDQVNYEWIVSALNILKYTEFRKEIWASVHGYEYENLSDILAGSKAVIHLIE